MIENRSSLFGIIALIIGVSGLGLGVFSVISSQLLEGSMGPPGEDGIDGIDGTDGMQGPPGPIDTLVGILNPDNGEQIWGNITINALIYTSYEYNLSILLNGSSIGKALPLLWNSSTVAQGWWNITVKVTNTVNNVGQDSVLVLVYNRTHSGVKRSYYVETHRDTWFDPPQREVYTPIPGLVIWFEVQQGESVYLRFYCLGSLYWASGEPGWRGFYYYFAIDGIRLIYPYGRFHIRSAASPNEFYSTLMLQHTNNTISSGLHNVTVLLYEEYYYSSTNGNSLLVQTYVP